MSRWASQLYASPRWGCGTLGEPRAWKAESRASEGRDCLGMEIWREVFEAAERRPRVRQEGCMERARMDWNWKRRVRFDMGCLEEKKDGDLRRGFRSQLLRGICHYFVLRVAGVKLEGRE